MIRGARRVLTAFAIVPVLIAAAAAQADEEAANKPHFVCFLLF